MNSRKLGQAVLYKYLKLFGMSGRHGAKLHGIVCEALGKEGKGKPEGRNAKKWVNENADYILERIGHLSGSPKKKVGRKKSAWHEPTYAEANSDSFLMSYEWRRLRMEVLKEHGARCQCCGATAKDGVRINVDHIKPRRIFPQLALEKANLQVLCEVCNHGKGNWDMTDWRPPVEEEEETRAHLKSIMRGA